MKKASLLFFIFVMTLQSLAQHCPFDGAHLIAVKVVDRHGKTIKDFSKPFYLQEVDNPMADSCLYSAGLLKKQLQDTGQFIADCDERYGRNGYNKALKERLTRAGVFSNAGLMINLNQAENTCSLVQHSESIYNDYIYRQRKFVIVFTVDQQQKTVAVPANRIYRLCTGSTDISHFKPVIIQL